MFNEVRVLFMGRECYEALSEQDLLEIYDEHQKDITDRAKANFQGELHRLRRCVGHDLLTDRFSLFQNSCKNIPSCFITSQVSARAASSRRTTFSKSRKSSPKTFATKRSIGSSKIER